MFQELITLRQERTATYTGSNELIQPSYHQLVVSGPVTLNLTIELFEVNASGTGAVVPMLAIDTADTEDGPWTELWNSSQVAPAIGTTVLVLSSELEQGERYRLQKRLRWRLTDYDPAGTPPTENIVCFRIDATAR